MKMSSKKKGGSNISKKKSSIITLCSGPGEKKSCPSEKNNKFLADVFNVKEVKDLGHLLDIIEKQK